MKFSVAILLAAACLAIAYAQEAETTAEAEVTTKVPFSDRHLCEEHIKECVRNAIHTPFEFWNPLTYGRLVISCVKPGPYCAMDVIASILAGGKDAIGKIVKN